MTTLNANEFTRTKETEKAICIDYCGKVQWIPKSVIAEDGAIAKWFVKREMTVIVRDPLLDEIKRNNWNRKSRINNFPLPVRNL